MNKIKMYLSQRKIFLQNLVKQKNLALSHAPEGFLRICNYKNKPRYYYRDNPQDFNGHYIRSEDSYLAAQLAQKDYDSKILVSARKELKAIDTFYSLMPHHTVEDIYSTLHPARQSLISPIQLSDEQYIKYWQSYKYPQKPFAEDMPTLYTSNGERVRSKSEIMIADLLHREKVPYRYECPLYLNGHGTIHPDFTLLRISDRKELYWEHLGIMDDPEYAEKAVHRINSYIQNEIFPGDRLILSFETRYNPLNSKIILQMIQQYL